MDKLPISSWRRRVAVVAATALTAALPIGASQARAAGFDSPVTVTAGAAKSLREYRSTWIDGFTLTGESVSPIVVAISLSDAPSGTTFTVKNPGSAALNFGYPSFQKVSSVSFTSNVATAKAALKSLSLNTVASGKVKVNVSVTVDERGFVFNSKTNHYYQYVAAPAIKWTDAYAAAAAKTFRGVSGHLATPSTGVENDFLSANIEGASDVWIAASDKDNEGEFKWVAGDEAGTTFWKARCAANTAGSADSCTGANNVTTTGQANGMYKDGVIDNPLVNTFSAWDASTKEPNNWGGLNVSQGGENYVATNWKGTYGLWNDLPNSTSSIGGYVVEYPNEGIKPFVGVSTSSQTFRIEKETSLYKPASVSSTHLAGGSYTVTWTAPKVLKVPLVKIQAKKLISGYTVINDVNDDVVFVKPGEKFTANVRGVPGGIKPTFGVITQLSKSPLNRDGGQRTFGNGVTGAESTDTNYITLTSPKFTNLSSTSKIIIFGKNADTASWSLTNGVDGKVLAQGTATGGAFSGSVRLPNIGTLVGWQQINVKLTLTKTDGSTYSEWRTIDLVGKLVVSFWGVEKTVVQTCTRNADRSLSCTYTTRTQIPYWLSA